MHGISEICDKTIKNSSKMSLKIEIEGDCPNKGLKASTSYG